MESGGVVNNDTQPHNIVSDPVNEHTQCPAINSVGYLPPGATRQTLTLISTPRPIDVAA